MTVVEFNKMVRNELENGDKRVVYLCKKNKDIFGGMCDSKELALIKCHNFYKESWFDDDCELNILIYGEDDIEVLGRNEILLQLNFISQMEYATASLSFCY